VCLDRAHQPTEPGNQDSSPLPGATWTAAAGRHTAAPQPTRRPGPTILAYADLTTRRRRNGPTAAHNQHLAGSAIRAATKGGRSWGRDEGGSNGGPLMLPAGAMRRGDEPFSICQFFGYIEIAGGDGTSLFFPLTP
jgi:hypothetical protein